MKKLNRIMVLSMSIILSLGLRAQEKVPYKVYQGNGKKSNYGKMLKELAGADVILFGELHNNSIAHWLQLEVTKDLGTDGNVTLGAEMFERDNQEVLEQYLNSEIDAKALDTLARLWPNYDTDYRPLVDYAKENEISFIGTNVPRRYANMVYRGDFSALDTLSDEEKSWIAPLPIDFDADLPTYQEILSMMGDHGTPLLVKAQAIKDATMAHFILENREDGKVFIHFNGAFHSNKYEGILWYLKRKAPDLNYMTISTVTQEDITTLDEENKGLADFVICVDEDVTNTY